MSSCSSVWYQNYPQDILYLLQIQGGLGWWTRRSRLWLLQIQGWSKVRSNEALRFHFGEFANAIDLFFYRYRDDPYYRRDRYRDDDPYYYRDDRYRDDRYRDNRLQKQFKSPQTTTTQNLTMTGTGMTTGTDMRTPIGTEDTEDVLEIGSIHKLGTIEPGLL